MILVLIMFLDIKFIIMILGTGTKGNYLLVNQTGAKTDQNLLLLSLLLLLLYSYSKEQKVV